MSKDVTRFLHQPQKQCAGLRFQQGRPLLDSDFNESARLSAEEQRLALLELLGPMASANDGFALGSLRAGFPPEQLSWLRAGRRVHVERLLLGTWSYARDFAIRPGSIYLGGLRFEQLAVEPVALQRNFLQIRQGQGLPVLYREISPSPYSPNSPYSPSSPHSPRSPDSPSFPRFRELYYLEGWEQIVTAVEDEELLESALGGADTTTRVRRMHRVKAFSDLPEGIASCDDAFSRLVTAFNADNGVVDRNTGEIMSRGRLGFTFVENQPQTNCSACEVDPIPGYLGSENQALRIMLTSASTFVWALDNAAPLYRVKVTGLGSPRPTKVTVTLLTQPKDAFHQARAHQVVEILPFGAVLPGAENASTSHPHFQKLAEEVGEFFRASTGYSAGTKSFELDISDSARLARLESLVWKWDDRHPAARALNQGSGDGDARYFYMRLWHQADEPWQIEMPIGSGGSAQLLGRTGLMPRLYQPGRRGDWWLATLRMDTPQRMVPFDLLSAPNGVAPHGPRHFVAPLALVSGDDDTVLSAEDCRNAIRRVAQQGCVTRTVGDAIQSFGDFTTIQAAIDSLPVEGGMVHVLPGEYRESVHVEGRSKVVIRGCGEGTVVEPQPGTTTTPVFEIKSSDAVTVEDLRICATSAEGVRVSKSSTVNLTGLLLTAGTWDNGKFAPRPQPRDLSIITVSESSQCTLGGLQFASGVRSALAVSQSSDISLEVCHNHADSQTASEGPSSPLWLFTDVRGLSIEQCDLDVYARFGLQLRTCQDAVISHVTLSGWDLTTPANQAVQTVLDVDNCDRVRVEMCKLSQRGQQVSHHAAVVVHGRDLLVENNHIEVAVAKTAWGGIQVRGGSQRIEVRRNRIAGGLGHGVTIGSVSWGPVPTVVGAERRGAGFGMYPLSGTVGFVSGDLRSAVSGLSCTVDGDVSDLSVSANRIEACGTNGVSVLTVLGLPGDKLINTPRIVIEDNDIIANLTVLGEVVPITRSIPFESLQTDRQVTLRILPYGGIVLACASAGAVIRNNVVAKNGTTAALPICGLFVLIGEGITISRNRLSENGVSTINPPSLGLCAGIMVVLAGTGASSSTASLGGTFAPPLDTAGLALRVDGNEVRQPEGRALLATALGPMSICDNFLSSDGCHRIQTDKRPFFGDVVSLENLAAPWESRGVTPNTVLPSGVTTIDGTLAFLSGKVPNNTSAVWGFISLGGSISFHNNQVTLNWLVDVAPNFAFALYSVAIRSLDHVSVCGNEFVLRFSGKAAPLRQASPIGTGSPLWLDEPMAAQLYAAGTTVEVVYNQFSETVGSVVYSASVFGELASTVAYNQGTHPFIAREPNQDGSGRQVFPAAVYGNQILLDGQRAGTRVSTTGSRDLFQQTFLSFVRHT